MNHEKQKNNEAKKQRSKKIMIVFLFLCFFAFLAPVALASVTLESGIPGADTEAQAGTTTSITLDRYINLLYLFVLGFVGIAGFVSLVIWGVVWTFSGVVDKKSMAMEGIKNTLIGIGIALTAYLILFTINPSLVNITGPDINPIQSQKTQSQSSQLGYVWRCDSQIQRTDYVFPNCRADKPTGCPAQCGMVPQQSACAASSFFCVRLLQVK